MQTLQQRRARYALEAIQAAVDKNVNRKEYLSYASALPAMIRMNGLGQAAAFYRSRGGTHGLLYQLLSDWFCKEKNAPYDKHKDLLEGITQSDLHAYRLAQAEALALLDWVKKFSKAFMKDDDNEGSGNS